MEDFTIPILGSLSHSLNTVDSSKQIPQIHKEGLFCFSQSQCFIYVYNELGPNGQSSSKKVKISFLFP